MSRELDDPISQISSNVDEVGPLHDTESTSKSTTEAPELEEVNLLLRGGKVTKIPNFVRTKQVKFPITNNAGTSNGNTTEEGTTNPPG